MPSGAGVLLVCHNRVLLGKESDGWSGFGGKSEYRETSLQTAARETQEETAGIVSAEWIQVQRRTRYESRTPSGAVFQLYIIFVLEEFAIDDFQSRRDTLQAAPYREKTELRWVDLDKVRQLRLRHGFQGDWECIRMAIECAFQTRHPSRCENLT